MEDYVVVELRAHPHAKRRPSWAGKGKQELLKNLPVGLGSVGAPHWSLTAGAADCQFVHENRTGSRHTKKYLKMKVGPNMLLKTNAK